MSSTHEFVRPNTYLFLRLPSDLLKLIEIKPNTIIDVGKLGCFSSNLLLGRPYFVTYELLDRQEHETFSRLRAIPPDDLNAEVASEDGTLAEDGSGSATPTINGMPRSHDLLAEDGTGAMKNNRLTIDNASRQTLTQQDIEELKQTAGGREIIEKILANHTGLSEKTAFAKAKYTLRKTKKYLKRFTVLPMNMDYLIDHVLEKEATRIMEMRQETLALICAWSNVHHSSQAQPGIDTSGTRVGGGRWLVADDTGGLLVAAMAEKMGILYHDPAECRQNGSSSLEDEKAKEGVITDTSNTDTDAKQSEQHENMEKRGKRPSKPSIHRDFPAPALTNSITVLHPAVQPNLSFLKYFGYDTNLPDTSHPLHEHLKSLSYLQLMSPEEDPLYQEPDVVPDTILHTWKSGKRGTYWKKRRRWERCRNVVDEAREGGFDGLVVASSMDAATILPCTVPLVRGGGQVVVYAPTAEPLVELMDLYSKERRTAYVQHIVKGEIPDPEDFPVDPRLLLAPMLQTSRVREWQVLPGRTHPLMSSRGGSEGYVFSARKVIPLEGGVEARGHFASRKRKVSEQAVADV